MPTVIVYWSPGRSQEQKEEIVREVTETFIKHGKAARNDILILFQELEPGNAARGGILLSPPIFDPIHDHLNTDGDGLESSHST